jgi:hypothetical protein
VYSIPAYALRFSAHCRSRLKYLDAAHDEARGSTVAGPARLWIRFTPHDRRAILAARCAKRRVEGANP